MALFKKRNYRYYVVYKFKKEDGSIGTSASFVVTDLKVKTMWSLRLLKELTMDLDDELVEIVILNWTLLK